jgi:hypothetical protein
MIGGGSGVRTAGCVIGGDSGVVGTAVGSVIGPGPTTVGLDTTFESFGIVCPEPVCRTDGGLAARDRPRIENDRKVPEKCQFMQPLK